MMHELSLKAYREQVEPTLTEREAQVLQAIREIGQGTCYQVADHMRKRANQISGRFKKLKEKGRIEGTVVGGSTVWREVVKEPRQLTFIT